ncbi:zinc finger MYM-type protein 2-like [Diadema antillarum]|uniref:zinc finger MYM-type protein 2-like n=1 Tax=Diadema antillarum TaxID=105358 RepID=UPI003A87D159
MASLPLRESGRDQRFLSLSEVELQSIVDGKDSRRTKDVINHSLSILRAYCEQKNIDFSRVTEHSSSPELNTFLRTFYAEVRRGDGELYAKRSMITIRYGLHRYLLKHRQVDITKDDAFQSSCEMFNAVLHMLKTEGKGVIRHKDPITTEDMDKIRQSSAVDPTTPKGLQNKVFLDLMLHLCNRGRENLRQMKKDDFAVDKDSANQRYVHLVRDMTTKNHRGGADDDEKSQCGRMYETGESDCPVASFCDYKSRLNEKCDAFWQRPKAARPAGNPWYDNMAVGMNTLGNKMAVISSEAKCSRVYTNHCLRATAINKLDTAGFEARHIMSISGHKSESSIKHYSRVEESQKRRMSLTIASTNRDLALRAGSSTAGSNVTDKSTVTSGPTSSTTSNVAPPSPPQSSQLDLSQPTASPVNISTSVSSQMHLHFHNCKVKVIYNQK